MIFGLQQSGDALPLFSAEQVLASLRRRGLKPAVMVWGKTSLKWERPHQGFFVFAVDPKTNRSPGRNIAALIKRQI